MTATMTWTILSLAAMFLFVAGYKAWREQRELVKERDARIATLQKELDDLTKSAIGGEIPFAILGAQSNGSHIGMVVNLTNTGASSAIDPSSWELVVLTTDGRSYPGSPNTLLDKNLDFCLGPRKAMRFVRKDALYLKASDNPVGHNGFVQGFLWFGIPNLSDSLLKDRKTLIKVSAKSVAGQKIQISATVEELMALAMKTSYFPGIENPRPLDMPCRENAYY